MPERMHGCHMISSGTSEGWKVAKQCRCGVKPKQIRKNINLAMNDEKKFIHIYILMIWMKIPVSKAFRTKNEALACL